MALAHEWDMSDPNNPVKDGRPFTFQHIPWGRLPFFVDQVLDEIDPEKKAAVHAGVFDMYSTNSKRPKKLPPRGVKRKSGDTLDESSVAQAQEKFDREARYTKCVLTEHKPGFKSPDWVKRRLKTTEKNGELDVDDFCQATGTTKGEYYHFLEVWKKQELFESKVYHEAVPWLLKRAEDKENKKPRIDA